VSGLRGRWVLRLLILALAEQFLKLLGVLNRQDFVADQYKVLTGLLQRALRLLLLFRQLARAFVFKFVTLLFRLLFRVYGYVLRKLFFVKAQSLQLCQPPLQHLDLLFILVLACSGFLAFG